MFEVLRLKSQSRRSPLHVLHISGCRLRTRPTWLFHFGDEPSDIALEWTHAPSVVVSRLGNDFRSKSGMDWRHNRGPYLGQTNSGLIHFHSRRASFSTAGLFFHQDESSLYRGQRQIGFVHVFHLHQRCASAGLGCVGTLNAFSLPKRSKR